VNDLAPGLVVMVIAAAPVALLVLFLADGLGLEGAGRVRRGARIVLAVLSIPSLVWFGIAAWGWSGAAHLKPLCQAYATPEYRAVRPVPSGTVLLDVVRDTAAPSAAVSTTAPPPWARAFGAQLITDPASPAAATAPLALEVRRVTRDRSRWFTVEMERFRLLRREWGTVLAEGDELWVTAGRARYHCGIVSGPLPVRADRSPWPGGDGVARFVARGLQPAPPTP
jgi:hypothetical protein